MPVITTPRGLIGRYFTWKTSTPPRWIIIFTPILVNFLSGLYPVVLKLFASEQDSGPKPNPFVFTLYRCLGSVPVLLTGSYLVEGRFPFPDPRMILVFLTLGFFGIFIGQYAYIGGVFILPAPIASALQPLIPVWTSILSVILCTEPIPSFNMLHSWAKIVGIIIALGGAVKLALAGYKPDTSQSASDQLFLGYFFLLLETVSAGLNYVLQKKLVFVSKKSAVWREYPMAVTGYACLFGAFYQVLFCSYYLFTGQTQAFHIPQHSLPALVYAMLITSSLCYYLTSWTTKHLPVSILTAFWPIQVVSTTTFAYLLLGDTLTYMQLFSASAIIGGLFLVVYSTRVDERISKTGEGGVKLDSCFRTTQAIS